MLATGGGAIVNTSSLGGLVAARFNTTNSMNRMASPSEIGPAAAWLLSDQASFVHGVRLPVDGGFTAG